MHALADILRARILAIACGYEDADDLDHLRSDPALKLACGHLPDSGAICVRSRPCRAGRTHRRLREVVRLMRVMVDLYCASYDTPPAAVTLDIDDTVDVVHGHQQLSMFNAHYDERCFLPIHVYDTATSRPVAVLLRPGKTPSGHEIRGHLRRLVRAIRRHWPHTRLTIRGDSHYGRPEVMEWCEDNGIDYVFGLSGNDVLRRLVEPAADDVRVRRAEANAAVLRRYTETRYGAKSWRSDRRVAARIEATTQGLDIRYVVTSLMHGSAEWVYDSLYCARGQAENLIKLHKSQLASDRTSCRSPLANQVRLVLHTAAYWLMLTCATPFQGPSRSPRPSSPRCGHGFSRLPPASPKPPPACASPSPLPAPKLGCSAASPAACNPQDRDQRGACPSTSPDPTNPQRRPAQH